MAAPISVIDVSLDEYGNDSQTFGTTFTIKVGNTATPYPAAVTVLNDGSRAYTANQGDDGGTGNGTVSIVNLSSHTIEKTLAVWAIHDRGFHRKFAVRQGIRSLAGQPLSDHRANRSGYCGYDSPGPRKRGRCPGE